MFDVVIIGAGVVGAMTARLLSQYRLNLCVLEKENDVAMGATKANSAIVHAGFDAKEGSHKANLNVRGSEMMEEICRDLGVKYQRNGSLVIGFEAADKEHLQLLLERGEKNGVKGLRLVEGEEMRALEPGLSDEAKFALYAPTGAIVCPYELTVAAIGNAMDNGAELKRNFKVEKIEKIKGGYRISSRKESVEAKYVINCAGLYSDFIASLVGDTSFSVHPRKGEYMLLDRTCGKLCRTTVFTCPTKKGKGVLVSSTVDGNLLLGPTSVDGEDKQDKTTTPEGLAEVREKVTKSVKNIPFNKVITSFCGLRAVGSTGDFILTSPEKGFLNAAGIESPGLSASPAIAEYLLEQLASQGLRLIKKESYLATRKAMHAFREASMEEKNEMIRKDPAYGRIVCRCEGVTEGEILAAIRQNPKACDLDGVKRRTRSQMGRCQGGFCSPYITELLAKEMGTPLEEVTKFGKGSHVVVGKTKGGRK